MKRRLLLVMSFGLLAACDEMVGPGPGTPGSNAAPTVDLTADVTEGNAPLAVNFTVAASDPDGDTLEYTLNFGDGESVSAQSAAHTYQAAGSYTASVTVDDGQGGSANDSVIIEVAEGGDDGGGDGGDDGDDGGGGGGSGGDDGDAEACTNPVEIPDEVLERAIRDTLDKQSGNLSCADMASLTELFYTGAGDDDPETNPAIESLMGLEYATSLKELRLGGNEISDLAPLQGLTTLELLDLGSGEDSVFFNNITDLRSLDGLVNLTSLNLHYINDVRSLQGLEKLINLEFLDVNGAQISDLAPLKNLLALREIDLTDNSVSNLTPLQNSVALETLTLADNMLTDLNGLEKLVGLTALDLSRNAVVNLTSLQSLSKLTDLSLSSNKVVDLTPIQFLKALTKISLDRNGLNDLAPLQTLTELASIDLSYNKISDLTPLAENDGLSTGDAISLYENPFDACQAGPAADAVSALRTRGVEVNFEDCP